MNSNAVPAASAARQRTRAAVSSRRALLLAAIGFSLALAIVSARVMHKISLAHPSPRHWALADFRDAIYFPVIAFVDGNNPYDVPHYMQLYPIGSRFPPYAPSTLIVHLPVALLSLPAASAAYFLASVGLILLLSWLALRGSGGPLTAAAVLAVGAALLISRAGHWALLLGQYSATVGVGTYLALQFAQRRPWLAAFGVALATIKPTFGVPLAFLLWWQGERRVAYAGIAANAALSFAALAVLVHSAGGIGAFAHSLSLSEADFAAEASVNPITTPFRVDTLVIIARLLGRVPGLALEGLITLVILTIGGLGLRRLAGRADEAARQLSMGLICVSIIICTYHQAYDLVLLALPLCALALRTEPWASHPSLRWVMMALLTLPAFNYLSSGTALDYLHLHGAAWVAVTSFNPVALTAAFAIYVAMALGGLPGDRVGGLASG